MRENRLKWFGFVKKICETQAVRWVMKINVEKEKDQKRNG